MLKLMRNSFHHLKWILIAIVAAFIFGFVFLDMGLGGALGGQQQDTSFAARVNGETISLTDYQRALQRLEQMYGQMYGGQFTPEMAAQMRLPNQAIEALIDQRLLTQEARRLKLDASPAEIRKTLLSIPVFTQDGKFVGMELYTRYVTGPMGYASPADFERDLAREIIVNKMDSALTNSVLISPKTAEAEYRRMNESAKIRFVFVPAAMQSALVAVTPAEVDAFYTANQQKYVHGEQRIVRYLLADYAKLRSQINPTEADLRGRYESSKDQYVRQESAHVLHILIKSEPGAAPAVDAAARAKAESIVAQLRAGADFAALAKANSEDPSSSGNGGDMGFVDRGQTVEPFDTAIFTLPLNKISDPVRSQEYGYHIVKVVERRPGGTRTFEEVRPELSARVAAEMAQEQAQNELARINVILRDKKPGDVNAFAALQNTQITSNDSGWFQKNEPIPGIGNHQPLADWAFGAKKGDVSPIVGTPRGPVIAYLQDVRPGGITAISEIRPKVEEDAKQAKAMQSTQRALTAMMTGATSIDQVAQKIGTPAQEATINRQAPIQGISGDTTELVNAAIRANVGEIKGPIATKDGVVVFQVTEQKKVTPEEIQTNRASFMDNLRQQQARNLRNTLLKKLRAASKIERNEELLRTEPAPQQRAGL